MKHGKYLLKIICFALITILLVGQVNYILMPKYYFDDNWPVTTTYKGFYQMEENTVDVLFFGSSHGAAAFNPQVLYDMHGIRSYNLSCEQQTPLTAYYWLQEALRFQTPKVVILDTLMLYEYEHTEPLNCEESRTRKAFDAMKWSGIKWQAIKDITTHDPDQTMISYLLTNIRYHARWTELNEQDFTYRELEKHYETKGYAPSNDKVDFPWFEPFSEGDTTACAQTVSLMQTYLERITKLCEEKGIELILTKAPADGWDCSKHNTVALYAEQNGLDFIDFNERETYEACDFVFTEDMNDRTHANIWGAEKMSSYFADLLQEKEKLADHDDVQWSATADYYQRIKYDSSIQHIDDILIYLDAIDQDRYTVLTAVRLDTTYFMTDEVKEKFRQLGLDMNMDQYDGYYGVVSEGAVTQKRSQESLTYAGSTRDGRLEFNISSAGYNANANCSIKIGGTEYAKNYNGINIVVYSNETWRVVDSVCYYGEMTRE
nr:hypothetical protein [Lachnospiraceae bacterium]MBQ8253829.1 hypothetical protein [Lachnospiraceae bacterium]